jgi:hypothetical protein
MAVRTMKFLLQLAPEFFAAQQRPRAIWVLSVGDELEARPLVNGPAAEFSPRFSPDGRWLAYVSSESGRPQVYLRPFPVGEDVVVSAFGDQPMWSADGTELFYLGPDDDQLTMIAVSVTSDGEPVQIGQPVPLFPLRVSGATGGVEVYGGSGNSGPYYAVMPDGRFLMSRRPALSNEREIVLVQNWFTELEQIVQTE